VRRQVLRGAGAAVLLVALWLVIAAVQAFAAYGDLRQARSDIEALSDLSFDGDMTSVGDEVTKVAAAFRSAQHRLEGLSVAPLRVLPVLGDDVRVMADLSAAGAAAGGAGEVLIGAIEALPEGQGSLTPAAGRLPLEVYGTLSPPLEQAAALLHRAGERVDRTRDVQVVQQVAAARDQIADRLPALTHTVRRAADLIDVLPGFLGADGPRRYLFLAQNPAEARGTGGFIGAYSVLTVDQGELSFSPFNEIQELPAFHVSQVIAPSREYARRYNRYGSAGFWHNINMTPDFPTAARAMLSLYAKGTGQRLDGVIATDPFALEGLIEVAGDVDVPGVGNVDADEVVDLVSNRAHAQFASSERRKRVLGGVAIGAFDALLDGSRDPVAVLDALSDAVRDGHIVLRSAEPVEQAAFVRAGIAGALDDPDGDFVAVVGNSGSATKLDYYISRTIAYDVELRADGSAASTVDIELHNAAPPDGISHRVIGPNVDGLEPGEQRLILSTYAQDGAELGSVDGGDGEVDVDTELGHAVFTTVAQVDAGDTAQVSLAWDRPSAWSPTAEGGIYRLTVVRQTTIPPTRVDVTIALPPGMTATALPEEAEIADGTITVSDDGRAPLVVEVGFTNADSQGDG
jgi:hypothetical protein